MATLAVPPQKKKVNAKHALFLVFAGMAVFVFVQRDLTLFDPASTLRMRYAVVPYWMLLHGIPATIALLVAPFQFSNRLRQKYLGLHRFMGRAYVVCVAIGAPSAVVVAFKIGPTILRMAATTQAVGWLITTATALYCIRTRRIKQHREWMFRSYPFAMVFVVARVINSIPALKLMGADARPSVVWTVIATACFLPSFILAWQAIAAEKPAVRTRR